MRQMHYAMRIIVYWSEWKKKARDSIADAVMGAECRRNVATLRGNHSLSRESLLVGRRLTDRLG